MRGRLNFQLEDLVFLHLQLNLFLVIPLLLLCDQNNRGRTLDPARSLTLSLVCSLACSLAWRGTIGPFLLGRFLETPLVLACVRACLGLVRPGRRFGGLCGLLGWLPGWL